MSEILGRLYYWIAKREKEQLLKEKHIIEVGSLKIKRPIMNAFRLREKRIHFCFQKAKPERLKVETIKLVDGHN